MQRPGASQNAGALSAKLVCTRGADRGREFPLRGEHAVIGRAPEVDVVLSDTSVSRRHVQLDRALEGWRATDLGSGNGTLLNGERVQGEVVLRHFDVLTMGQTELKFEDTANATDRALDPRAAASPPPRRPGGARPSRQVPSAQSRSKRFKVVLLGTVAFVALAALLMVLVRPGKSRSEGPQPEEERLAQLFQAGKNAVRQGRWKDAMVRFEEVKAVAPEYPELPAYLERAPMELSNEARLEEGETAVAEGKLALAQERLVQAKKGTTLSNPRIDQLDQKIRDAVPERVTQIEAAAQANEHARVVSLAEDLLQVVPNQTAAQAFLDNARAKLAEEANRSVRVTRRPRDDAPREDRPAIDAFRSGDLAGALARAAACGGTVASCRTLLKQLQDFEALHQRVDTLNASELRRLLALDRTITGGAGSTLARTARTRAANAFYKEASAEKASSNWSRAIELSLQALDAEPGHAGAKRMLDEIRGKAKDVYMQAYAVKDNDLESALQKFRDVTLMTPESDEWHQKAKGWLQKLSR
ncbi:MAG: FHA domain-containing protein [Myxococcaceae bacterium]